MHSAEIEVRRTALTCAGLALAASAQIGHLPVWILVLLYASLSYRLYAQWRSLRLPPRWVLVALVVLLTLPVLARSARVTT